MSIYGVEEIFQKSVNSVYIIGRREPILVFRVHLFIGLDLRSQSHLIDFID